VLLLISKLLLNALSHRLVSVCIVNLRCEMVNKRINKRIKGMETRMKSSEIAMEGR